MITSLNAGCAESYLVHRSECYEEVEAYAVAREKQATFEVQDADVRAAVAERLFDDGCKELRSLDAYIGRTTKIDSSLVAVHNETRAVLLESSFGYAVVFGRKHDAQSALSELLLATHQLDWRLGERCLALSRLCGDLQEACREFYANYEDVGGTAVKLTAKAKSALTKAEKQVNEKRGKFRACRPSNTRDDLWFAENELRVASRRCSQLQASYNARVSETTSLMKRLEDWRDSGLEKIVEALTVAMTSYRDDLCRVGERLVCVARGSACLNDCDEDTRVGKRIKKARDKLPTFDESRDDFLQRQSALDSTAKSKGALVFPSMDVDEQLSRARHLAKVDAPPRDTSFIEDDDSPSRQSLDEACGPIPSCPPSRLVAKKGALEYERNVMGASYATLGFTPVFLVLTFDGFLSAYPGRTEGAVEHETPAFRCDLSLAQILDDDDETPTITISTKPKSNFAALVVGDRHIKLKCRDAAEKFSWTQALNDPLATFSNSIENNTNETSSPRDRQAEAIRPTTPRPVSRSDDDTTTTFV